MSALVRYPHYRTLSRPNEMRLLVAFLRPTCQTTGTAAAAPASWLRPRAADAAHDLAEFSCGKPSLDRWLKTRAPSNREKDFTAVLVVHEANPLIGYFGLAPTAIVPSMLPRSIRTGQPPDPVLCLLLGQLATDLNWIGKGIGTDLLKHALQRCVTAADLIGGRALIVKAVDVETAGFWRRRELREAVDAAGRRTEIELWLAVSTLQQENYQRMRQRHRN